MLYYSQVQLMLDFVFLRIFIALKQGKNLGSRFWFFRNKSPNHRFQNLKFPLRKKRGEAAGGIKIKQSAYFPD